MNAPVQVQIESAPPGPMTIDWVLRRGVASVMPEEGLGEILSGPPIRLYLGIDPTSPNLHIGHLVPLRKLRQLQDLGHKVILLFGTFTGMIGDPSDKSAARVRLTPEQVAANVATYKEQAGLVLDLSPNAWNPVEVVYNHEWLSPLAFMDVVELAANFTVNQLLARETYRKRLEENVPLYLHELLYPLMQGYDSYALSVQLEIGGKDQIPNMLAGTHLMRVLAGAQKWAMGMKLIEDPNGAKMGKTTGNVVNITEFPEVIYEALMSWPDSAIALGLELLTDVPDNVIQRTVLELEHIALGTSTVSPMALKEAFAYRVVRDLLGEDAANTARQIYHMVKREKQQPPRMKEIHVVAGTRVSAALVQSGLAKDDGEAASKLTQQAVRLNGQQIRKDLMLAPGTQTLELGKNSIKNIRKVIVS